ncbi:MAG: GNAT family N-acetyltransferase [Tissierellia bacterium]|nr:GNAT family N-acetyltransferase [Tissierellia bacterium]
MLDVRKLSDKYKVRKLVEKDCPRILDLQQSNPLYFEYCPPRPSIKTVLKDMSVLPPEKDIDDLYYVGFFEEEYLLAILHFIISFPDKGTIYIGLFMVDRRYSGYGMGSRIIRDVLDYFQHRGFLKVRLGYIKGNPQAKAFWRKCGFVPLMEKKNNQGEVVILEKYLPHL